MTHPRALSEQQAIDLEAWYGQYERIGSVRAKCEELGITPHTLYDAVRRIRGQETRVTRDKLSTFHMERTVIVQDELSTTIMEEHIDKAG